MLFTVNKGIFHAFLSNIRNYSTEVINIQRRKAEMNIILRIICHQHQARSGKIKANKTHQISVKTQVFFAKTQLQHIYLQLLVNQFILFLLIFFSKITI